MFENIEEKSEYTAFFLKKVIDTIIEHYYFDVTYEELYHAAIKGMTECLDNYSLYITKESKNEVQEKNKVVQDYFFHEIGNFKDIALCKIIRISEINKEAVLLLKETIKKLKENNVNTVVIDLRNNLGGFIDSTIEICNLLIAKKTLFKSSDKKWKIETYKSNLYNQPFNKVIVLTNNKTMSAAEVIALSLQEAGNIVIGQQTFGKGVSQEYFPIYGGGILKITTKEYFKNTGEPINKIGLIPDILIKSSDLDLEDSILNTAYNYIIKGFK